MSEKFKRIQLADSAQTSKDKIVEARRAWKYVRDSWAVQAKERKLSYRDQGQAPWIIY